MGKPTKIARQWNILRTLAAWRFGATVEELVKATEMDLRTVRRDLAEMKRELPIEEEVVNQHGKKRYKLREGEKAPIGFRLDHALALYVGRKFMEPLKGTPLWESLEEAFFNIRAAISENAIEHVERMTERIYVRTMGAAEYDDEKSELIDALLVAIEDCRQTVIVYQPAHASEPVEYGVHPYGMVVHRGSLYLVAFVQDDQKIKHFKISRLHEVEANGPTFDRPESFKLTEHLANSFGVFQGTEVVKVTVRFAPAVARYVQEANWHSSQKLSKQRDGGVIAKFELSAIEEIKAWILSFGANAEVLEPLSLRAAVIAELDRMFENYRSFDRSNATDLNPNRDDKAPRLSKGRPR